MQSAPLSAGGLRVQIPSGPPFYRSVAQSLERAAWDREAVGENPTIPTIFNAAVAELSRHPSSKRINAGESPASSANF
jgi:hypothetical protein